MSRTGNLTKVATKAIPMSPAQRVEVKTQRKESQESSKVWLQVLTIALIVNFIILMAIL